MSNWWNAGSERWTVQAREDGQYTLYGPSPAAVEQTIPYMTGREKECHKERQYRLNLAEKLRARNV